MISPVISSGEVSAVCLSATLAPRLQDHDPVGDRKDVRHAVADQHHGHSLRLEAADQLQHLRHLAHRDCRGGLIHQHDLGIGKPGAGDGDRLALAARHFLDKIARPGFRLELAEEFAGAVDHRLLVENLEGPDALLDLAAEKDVLGGGQIVGECQVLIDDLDALHAGLDRLVEVADLPFDRYLAFAWRKIPGNELDHGGLAGAIVAHEAHDFAWLDREADVAQRPDRAEIL